ncbi:MAG: response regulator [Bdellovibrionales bacterium]|nr:response regulator [Bdellovibrionales bacterium]
MKFFKFAKKENLPSIEKALSKFVKRVEYEAIVRGCPDRRQLVRYAAEVIGKDEHELLRALGERMLVKVAPRVIPTEAQHLPKEVTLAQLRLAGCIPIIRDHVFRGVICTDPSRIPEPYRSYESLEYLLASWEEIAKALGESERSLEELRAHEQEKLREREQEMLLRVLHLLIGEVESHGRDEAKLSISEDSIRYLFTSLTGRSGSGQIHQALLVPLLGFLESVQQRIGEKVISIQCIEKGRLYRLNWEGEEERAQQSEEGVPQPIRVVKTLPPTGVHYTVSVLVIDDSETFGSVIERFFAREGITVERRTSAKDALAELANGSVRPRVIVSDLHMPDMSGSQFVREFKSLPGFEDVAIFMLTSDEEIDSEVDAIRLGVEAYLRKNEDPRLLCAHVERVLEGKRSIQQAA